MIEFHEKLIRTKVVAIEMFFQKGSPRIFQNRGVSHVKFPAILKVNKKLHHIPKQSIKWKVDWKLNLEKPRNK